MIEHAAPSGRGRDKLRRIARHRPERDIQTGLVEGLALLLRRLLPVRRAGERPGRNADR